ncbi:response regulator transcription factor [Neolewinella agarilytica]|uniref:Two component transcriptional regulator, LuxR family n=1 Tax=Neolewinella agarilytica TaxID=478744 RepID=A0A1H8Z7L2_9BACT|nr:response regulator transcription factor [Neolewinella agarilytica]SEP59598.1 two component transcriptional regulator, LuxR family [Neolewinella agarilytica]
MENVPVRIALVDDQKLFRGGMKMILADRSDFEVVFEAKNGKQFFERLAFEPVDVVILDVEMPEMDGIETLERLRSTHDNIRVIMLTMHDSDRLISHLMELGANGFLLKDEDPDVVCEAVERVAAEGIFFRDYVSKALLKKSRNKMNSDNLIKPRISDREMEVLQLICKEFTSKEIAEKLFISYRTVEGHRRSLQEKTGSRNIVGLVMYAVQNGLV